MAEPRGPGLFAYTWAEMPGAPRGAYQWVGRVLQATAGLGVAWIALAAGLMVPSFLHGAPFGGIGLLVEGFAAASIVGWAVAGSWFVSYSYYHWTRFDRRGLLHAFLLGLFMAWMGGFGLFANWSIARDLGTRVRWDAAVSALCNGLALVLGLLLLLLWSLPAARKPFAPPPLPAASAPA